MMPNTYTIQGLKVPEVDAEIAKIREELSSLRTLFGAAVDAITRLDADVAALAGTDVAALASENAHMRVERAAKDQESVAAWHERKRLRAALARLVDLGNDDGAEPTDAWKRAWEHAAAVLGSDQP